jgi:hypothetical protein
MLHGASLVDHDSLPEFVTLLQNRLEQDAPQTKPKPSQEMELEFCCMQIRRKSSTARSDEDRVLHDIEASEIRATHLILAEESMIIMPQTISTPPPQPKFHEAVQQSTIV